MRITKIESQKRNPSRKSLYADESFLLGVSEETLIRFGIRTGDEIGEEKLRALQAAEEQQSAKNVALRFLSRRQRTEREVRDRLREREYGDEDIEQAIEHLRDLKFLNDEEFARSYIRNQLALRPKGIRALKQKLLLLGVRKETIDAAISEAFAETSQEDAAREAAERFLAKASRKNEDPRKRKQKLIAFLSRRGFAWDVVSDVAKKTLGPALPGEKEE